MSIWIQFLLCTAVIVYAGSRLSHYGDLIAERSGLGRTWIGVVLMASVTSLPELITGASSVALYNVPDIAAGDVFGSCMFNMAILSFMDGLGRGTPLASRANPGQVLAAAFGIVMLATAGVTIVGNQWVPTLGWISLTSLILLGTYMVAMRVLFLYEQRRAAEHLEEVAERAAPAGLTGRQLLARYSLNAALVVAAAVWLPSLGEKIVEETGLGQSFVASMFVALATSLPELVVSISAVRIGSVELVLGNLIGSNLFNLGILALDDIFYIKGSLYGSISHSHLVPAWGSAAMMAIAIAGITFRAAHKRYALAWDSVAMLAIYASASVVLYQMH